MKHRFAIVTVLATVFLVYGQIDEITQFRVPEYDENGQMESQIFGDYAKIIDDSNIDITGLRIEFYDGDDVDILVTAPHCLYNRARGQAESDSSVRIARDNTVITGADFSYSMEAQQFVIRKNARVVFRNIKSTMETGETL